MRWKPFFVGFVSGFTLFVVVNIHSYAHAIPTMDDGFASFGIPFESGGFGGFVSHTYFVWPGMIANSLVAICAGIVLAWAAVKLWPLFLEIVQSLRGWHKATRP